MVPQHITIGVCMLLSHCPAERARELYPDTTAFYYLNKTSWMGYLNNSRVWPIKNFSGVCFRPEKLLCLCSGMCSHCSLRVYLRYFTTISLEYLSDFAQPKESEWEDKVNIYTTKTFINTKRISVNKCTFNIGDEGSWGGGCGKLSFIWRGERVVGS